MDDAAYSRVGTVQALATCKTYGFSKQPCDQVDLIAGLGVSGDVHAGATVRHRSRMVVDPGQPNLRQVHLLHGELLDQLNLEGFALSPGQLGENITTRGIDLLALPRGTVLAVGGAVRLEVTGLRNPCGQIEAFRPGLLGRLARKLGDTTIERLAGIMAVVQHGGPIAKGDRIEVILPPLPHENLLPV
jgi:MOSC domain-containing protein YiiM